MTRRALFLWLLILLACFPAGWIIGQLPSGKAHGPRPEPRAELSRWTTLQQALADSRESGKPVLLDFNAEWCGPCRMMKQQVFEASGRSESVQAAVIPVSIVDRYRENGRNSEETESLQRQYRVEAFPTLVVFSPRTGRTARARGYRGPDWTVWWIQNSAQQVR